MAQYRQSGHYNANGMASDHVSIGILRTSPPHQQYNKPIRGRRLARSDKTSHRSSSLSIGFGTLIVIVVLSLVLVVTVLAYSYVSSYSKEVNDHLVDDDDELKNDVDFLANVTRTSDVRVLGFGQGSAHGRDSRYWDKDDRRRDGDYNEDDVDHDSKEGKYESTQKGYDLVKVNNGKDRISQDETYKVQRGTGLYNEDGRKELKMYEKEYEASLKKAGQSSHEDEIKHQALDTENRGEQTDGIDTDNEYNDGIDSHDPHMEDYGDSDHGNGDQAAARNSSDEDGSRELSNFGDADAETRYQNNAKDDHKVAESMSNKSLNKITLDNVNGNYGHGRSSGSQSTTKSRSDTKRKSKHRRGCEMKFLNSTTQLVEPFESRKFARFSLQYNEKEKPDGEEQWEPKFSGRQSLQEREESFLVHDQKINCGFVKGPEGSPSTGFELSEDDESYVSRCHIAVISCIFGNSDRLRSPPTKTVTRLSRKNVCFVMFMDELTLQTLSSEGHAPDTAGFIGFWKVVVVKNLPFADMRRVGKIPKLLPHRLFPSARYSIWLDSKLRLQLDPLLVLEYFLWRKGYEYAISNHYDRHCVWEEVAQNKRLNKYNHTIIDQQFTFYQNDGLKKFNASDPNKLLPSNVPEGSLIVRAHTPMSNLFSCLWFNEVERFTPRDQLSFAYTYQKLRRMNPDKPFYLHMFKDCERRAVAKLFRHRSEEKRNALRQQATE